MTMRVAVLVLVLVLALVASCRSGGTDWARIEHSVDAVCACTDAACVDRASADWNALPWPDLTTADRATTERSIALDERGNLCQVRQRSKPDLEWFAALAERMCACTDAACAAPIDADAVGWLQHMKDEPVGGRILAVAHDSIIRYEACHAALAGAPAGAPAPLPDSVEVRIAATADRICACTTMLCADLYDHELVDWLGLQYRRPGHDPTIGMVLSGPAKAANATYQRCHDEKSALWPHRSRLLQSYGIEP